MPSALRKLGLALFSLEFVNFYRPLVRRLLDLTQVGGAFMGMTAKERATQFVILKTAPPQKYVDFLTIAIQDALDERTEEIARFCEEMSGECGSKLAELIRLGHARG